MRLLTLLVSLLLPGLAAAQAATGAVVTTPQVRAELVAHALTIKGLSVAVLVPNFKGAQRAIECGAHKITLPLSCSESHSLKNLRRTHAQVLDEAVPVLRLSTVVGRY